MVTALKYIVLKVDMLFFLFFFFFFAYYVVLLLTVYWKADLALFLRPDLEKEKTKNKYGPVQSVVGNVTLHIGARYI